MVWARRQKDKVCLKNVKNWTAYHSYKKRFLLKTLKLDGKMNGEVKYYLIMEQAIAGELPYLFKKYRF